MTNNFTMAKLDEVLNLTAEQIQQISDNGVQIVDPDTFEPVVVLDGIGYRIEQLLIHNNLSVNGG